MINDNRVNDMDISKPSSIITFSKQGGLFLVLSMLISLIGCGGGSGGNYVITLVSDANGSISLADSSSKQGSESSYLLTPNPNYEVGTVKGCNGNLSGDVYTIYSVTGDCTINATFTLKKFNVEFITSENGAVNPVSTKFEYRREAEYTVTPDEGYGINSISGCDSTTDFYLEFGRYRTGRITEDCSVTIEFMKMNQVTLNSEDEKVAGEFYTPTISSNGRFVTFQTDSRYLLEEALEDVVRDIFVKDTVTGIFKQVSVNSLGEGGNNSSWTPVISDDGRFIVFSSYANNLLGGRLFNNYSNAYLHEVETSMTTMLSKSQAGSSSVNGLSIEPDISANGQFTVFESSASDLVLNDTNNRSDIFIRDTKTNTTSRISINNLNVEGDSNSFAPSISGDGHYVAFGSTATNLSDIEGSGVDKVFIRDVVNARTIYVGAGHSPSINSNGKSVAYVSGNNVYIYEIESATSKKITHDIGFAPVLSSSGRFVAFIAPGDGEVISDELADFDLNVYDTESGKIVTKIMNAIGKHISGMLFDTIYLDSKYSFSADESKFVFESKQNFGIETSGYNSSDIFVIECCD